MRRLRVMAVLAGVAALLGASAAITRTRDALLPLPATLAPPLEDDSRAQILDATGQGLAVTYSNAWNRHDLVDLHEVPPLLRQAFVAAEDRRFFEHGGVDWPARAAAVWQNLRARRAVRGASTISEQVVRMLHPRPRTLRSRWLEGCEAARLEKRFSKGEILEFYLNQVPYARQRRGVVQAARDYFDRDPDTLTPGEMLTLAVLVRAPGRWDPRRSPSAVEGPVRRLADHMLATGILDARQHAAAVSRPIRLREPALPVDAPHFVRYVRERSVGERERVQTGLDPGWQRAAREILERRLERLTGRHVTDGAVLVVDHVEDRIKVWVNAGGYDLEAPGGAIDAVLAPRQPGSALKPFVYAAAMEAAGWTPASLIDDAPLSQSVGRGLHRYRNYSRHYHGPIRLREALGNSLNVPAVLAVQEVGVERFHERLRDLGFTSLDLHPRVYGEGLALGNGEVSLLELVGAYAALARGGLWRPTLAGDADPAGAPPRRVFDRETASLIADILSDPEARRLEFGSGGALEFPEPTAVKTGTSNDYRDAWAVGFSDRHTVGVWMGNLDRRPTDGVTGAAGPAMVLRGVFAELRRTQSSGPLFLSRKLRRATICRVSGRLPHDGCPRIDEWFRPESVPTATCPSGHSGTATPPVAAGSRSGPVRLVQPTPGLELAMDPRIPDALERFEFAVDTGAAPARIDWIVNGTSAAMTEGTARYAWAVVPGEHVVEAVVRSAEGASIRTPSVAFRVK